MFFVKKKEKMLETGIKRGERDREGGKRGRKRGNRGKRGERRVTRKTVTL